MTADVKRPRHPVCALNSSAPAQFELSFKAVGRPSLPRPAGPILPVR